METRPLHPAPMMQTLLTLEVIFSQHQMLSLTQRPVDILANRLVITQ